MEIKKLVRRQFNEAVFLAWKVFCEYEAVDYPEDGKQAFYDAIHSKEYLDMLEIHGAYDQDKLVGILATRNEGNQIALFFVDGAYHRKGIGRMLWENTLARSKSKCITVHSSVYALNIYQKLGFVQTDKLQEENGIRYIPMEYDILRKAKTKLVCALAQPWIKRDRIYLDELESACAMLDLEEIDQIRIMHYLDDYAFLDGYMIWKESDVEKLANLLLVILGISTEQYNQVRETENTDELRLLVKKNLEGFSDKEIDGIIKILLFEKKDDEKLCGTTVRNLEDGVVIKVLKNEDGKICKDYYVHERFFKRIMKTGKSIAEGFFYDFEDEKLTHNNIYLALK